MRENTNPSQLIHGVLLTLYTGVLAGVYGYEFNHLSHPAIIIIVGALLMPLVVGLYVLRFTPARRSLSQPRMLSSPSALAMGALAVLAIADGCRLLLMNLLGEAHWQSLSWQSTAVCYGLALAIGCAVVRLMRHYFALRDIPDTLATWLLATFSKQFRFR